MLILGLYSNNLVSRLLAVSHLLIFYNMNDERKSINLGLQLRDATSLWFRRLTIAICKPGSLAIACQFTHQHVCSVLLTASLCNVKNDRRHRNCCTLSAAPTYIPSYESSNTLALLLKKLICGNGSMVIKHVYKSRW